MMTAFFPSFGRKPAKRMGKDGHRRQPPDVWQHTLDAMRADHEFTPDREAVSAGNA